MQFLPLTRQVELDSSNPEKLIVAAPNTLFYRAGNAVFYLIDSGGRRSRINVSKKAFALSYRNMPWYRTITEDAIFHPWSEGIQGKDVLCFVESGRNIPLELLRPNRTTVKILQIPVVKIEDEPDEIIIAYEQEERDAIGVEAGGQARQADRSIEIVPDVLFARPNELDRRFDFLGDEHRLADVLLNRGAPAEAAAEHHAMDHDLVVG